MMTLCKKPYPGIRLSSKSADDIFAKLSIAAISNETVGNDAEQIQGKVLR